MMEKITKSTMNLPDEPQPGTDGIVTIQFRSADGTKNFTRKFLKHHKVRVLYDYINSLGKDAGFEEEHCEFELMQNMPREVYNDMSKTLEEVKLFPQAKIYIRQL